MKLVFPKRKHLVDSKWIFTIKYRFDGQVERYKARLVARGFTQTYGLDYEETLLSLATNLYWPLLQFEVKNVFLNDDLKEEVFLQISPDFDNKRQLKKYAN